MRDEQKYLEEIQSRICPKCIDGDGRGNCLISRDAECALKVLFPQILEAIRSTYSTSMEAYEAALREKVCGVCARQASDGTCSLRNDIECALDRYFPLIVRAVEELDVKQRLARTGTRWV
jgi:hypothetical protein